MRIAKFVVLATSLALLVAAGAEAKRKPLQLSMGKQDVDLVSRTLTFRLNRPAEMAELKIFNLDGDLLEEKVEMYDGAPAGTELKIAWPKLIDDPENFVIELKVHDVDEYWTGMSICRFHGEIPHEEVVFESGKWEIRPSEAPKLEAAIPRILEMLERSRACDPTNQALYVAGYTDTVGSVADNRELSRKRARAIAEYFIKNGLKKQKISIYARGFGEEVLAVETGDNVDEEKNRRADYIISNFHPEMPGPGSWVRVK